ncbi:DUF6923 family protein [Tenacibaculum aiptasiae]|uniref:DUF6923 family protein n=1 Tax=Tenacibaculum aiptasiae TaxID=426481 RepID=UPI003B599953
MIKTITLLRKLLCIFIAFFSLSIVSQNTPFNCVYNAYLFQFNDVYSVDLASGNSYLVAEDITPGSINAAAYNPQDGFIWGSLSTPSKTIVRIGNDFQVTTYYIDELPTTGRYIGGINPDGVYYLKGGGTTYYKIDLDPDSPTYGQHLATETLSANINIHDWAFNAVDGNLYTVEKKTNILYRVDPSNGVIQSLGEVPIMSGLNYTYGAVYFDASGRFYVSANQTGTIYVIQAVQDLTGSNAIDSNLFAFGPSSSSNDGARCPTAPVPQEICDNGIDDDGDGLVDCDDPSCSGYGNCSVILAPTSGGNEGGLESNNRLSEQINKRNYNRAKVNYKFDRSKAARIQKSSNYKKKKGAALELKDFIPLDVIKEDEVVESSPTDLIAITNATDIYAVDYVEQGTPVASILALKTENGVYEHTKYICDRLLGAELISVSTIEIEGHQFIKSLIKNADNTVEFSLSLSAKAVNNDANFEIESHWNLDKYENNVGFYNFQIWSNSLDDLYLLANELVSLLNAEKPISGYKTSKPPTVFVRKGKYNNGSLDLQIINRNRSGEIEFDAGYRETETSSLKKSNSTINLEQNYITNLKVATGNLFDIGFRLGDGIATPDDLFMSDGPWGVDASGANTVVSNYAIAPNDYTFEANDFPVERNVALTATTSTFIAAYRALTPRFMPVDLSDYNGFKLKAKGTGKLEITFVKKSITSFEDQYKTTIALSDSFKDYVIPFTSFVSKKGGELVLDDIATIVFKMVSEDGSVTTKEMNLTNIRFSKIDFTELIEYEGGLVTAVPNPVTLSTSLYFKAQEQEDLEFVVYNQLGKLVYKANYKAEVGINKIDFNRQSLHTGLYFCKIISKKHTFKPVKLLVH